MSNEEKWAKLVEQQLHSYEAYFKHLKDTPTFIREVEEINFEPLLLPSGSQPEIQPASGASAEVLLEPEHKPPSSQSQD